MNQLLLEAITKNDIQMVAEIVRLQPDLATAVNNTQETPVHEACRQGNLEVLKILVAANSWAPYMVNDKNQSALYLACEIGHHQLVRFCLWKRQLRLLLELFEANDADLPCLHVAVSKGHAAVVQELIIKWPNLAKKEDENGCTSLHHACKFGNSEITRMLLILNPNLASSYDNGGFTPLHIAAMLGKTTVFKEFEERAPSAFQVLATKEKETVFHLTIRHNQVAAFFSLMQLLDDSNDLFNRCDGNGNSLLHLALSTMCLEVAECLINKATSIQLETRNYAGFTAMDILEMSNQDDLLTIHLKDCLLNRLAKIELTQLHQARGNVILITEHHTTSTVSQSNLVAASLPRIESIPQHQGTERNNGRANDFDSDRASSPQIDTTRKDDEVNQEQQYLQIHLSKSLEALIKLQKMMREDKQDYEKRRQRKMQAMHMEALQNARNTIIIITVLITTVTFTASLSPPGGFFQGGPQSGKPALGQTTAFKVFEISNDMALFLSLCIVIVLVSVVPFRKRPLRKLLALAHKALWLAVSFLATAYVAARWATLQHVRQEERLFGVVISICGGFLGVVFLWSGVMLINNKLRKSEWRRQRSGRVNCKSVSTDSDMESNVGDGFHWY